MKTNCEGHILAFVGNTGRARRSYWFQPMRIFLLCVVLFVVRAPCSNDASIHSVSSVTIGQGEEAFATSVVVDPSGNAFVAGLADSYSAVWIAKVSSSLVVLATTTVSINTEIVPPKIALDREGNLFVIGDDWLSKYDSALVFRSSAPVGHQDAIAVEQGGRVWIAGPGAVGVRLTTFDASLTQVGSAEDEYPRIIYGMAPGLDGVMWAV